MNFLKRNSKCMLIDALFNNDHFSTIYLCAYTLLLVNTLTIDAMIPRKDSLKEAKEAIPIPDQHFSVTWQATHLSKPFKVFIKYLKVRIL